MLLTETVRVSGLDRLLAEALSPWHRPNAVHGPSKVLLDLAITVVAGGVTLADVAVLRAEPSLYGPVASDPTVSRVIAALAADARRCCGRSTLPEPQPAPRCGVWLVSMPPITAVT